MNASENMKARLVDYIEAFNAADAARVVALFADNASVEDPVGTPLKEGRSEIETFYTYATSVGARLELMAPPRGSHGNSASISFRVHIAGQDGRPAYIDVTDVMDFDAAGKIVRMRAYWGADDYHVLAAAS
ncbi:MULTISPECIES: nuclear transport factor 2 family protein [Paraburkholderia]|jgi:steroid delta-isomerase|uniref:Nuclear transport factor 2 family protein n=1 Tax=Paraburkholderia agricolaris TaxID=2152888 RepID=A0ABW8ZJV8_9BURK|nr:MULTISPECIES: nuclear transport factor 2 family protein [Paraburkholderia]MDE1007940.1 nuclear transport factor 2 family protein [Paraburkholderia fungorum]